MNNEISILKKFKENLILFFDELISQFPDVGELIVMRILVKDSFDTKFIMDNFNHKMNTDNGNAKKMVAERNESFFLEHDILDLGPENKEKSMYFKKLWRSGRLDEDDKNTVWDWFDLFIKLGDKYSTALDSNI